MILDVQYTVEKCVVLKPAVVEILLMWFCDGRRWMKLPNPLQMMKISINKRLLIQAMSTFNWHLFPVKYLQVFY